MMPLHRLRWLPILWFGLLLVPSTSTAQVERYELGKRLQRFELAWQRAGDTTNGNERRAASAESMSNAVQSFFGGQFDKAAQQIDTSWFVVSGTTPAEFERNAIAYSCQMLPMVIDSTRRGVQIQVQTFYQIGEMPNSTKIELALVLPQNGDVITTASKLLKEAIDSGWNWNHGEIPASDYVVRFRIANGKTGAGESVDLANSSFSVIDNFDRRLNILEQALKDMRGQIDDSLFSTARELTRTLRSLHDGKVLEIDYPANRLLEFAELVISDPDKAQTEVASRARQADVWMTLAQKRKRVPVRLRAPTDGNSSLPVLFLFHGAGGSENMFFETCGAGRCVHEGLKRDWLVVAPRQRSGRLVLDCEQMLDELEKFFDIDRTRVFLVGHSMGGGQVVRQVASQPRVARAAVVLGGGGRVNDFSKLANTPWYVAAGELDFGRRGAVALSQRLEQAGAKVKYREFKDVEHMVIVQAATDELFQFLDQVNID